MNNKSIDQYRELEFEKAVSHKVHSRIFEILGYLDSVDKSKLLQEDRNYLLRIEELSKALIEELHSLIDYYSQKKH
jgi:hypothetical protein